MVNAFPVCWSFTQMALCDFSCTADENSAFVGVSQQNYENIDEDLI
jgi:hypothetical protein